MNISINDIINNFYWTEVGNKAVQCNGFHLEKVFQSAQDHSARPSMAIKTAVSFFKVMKMLQRGFSEASQTFQNISMKLNPKYCKQ